MWANCNHKEHNWATYGQHSHLWERKTVFLSTPGPLPSSSSQRLTCDSATCVFYSRLAAARGQRAAEMPGCLSILPVSRCKRMKERMVFIHLYWEAGKQWRAGSGGGGQAGGEGWQTKRRSREDKRRGGGICVIDYAKSLNEGQTTDSLDNRWAERILSSLSCCVLVLF